MELVGDKDGGRVLLVFSFCFEIILVRIGFSCLQQNQNPRKPPDSQ